MYPSEQRRLSPHRTKVWPRSCGTHASDLHVRVIIVSAFLRYWQEYQLEIALSSSCRGLDASKEKDSLVRGRGWLEKDGAEVLLLSSLGLSCAFASVVAPRGVSSSAPREGESWTPRVV